MKLLNDTKAHTSLAMIGKSILPGESIDITETEYKAVKRFIKPFGLTVLSEEDIAHIADEVRKKEAEDKKAKEAKKKKEAEEADKKAKEAEEKKEAEEAKKKAKADKKAKKVKDAEEADEKAKKDAEEAKKKKEDKKEVDK